MDDVQRGNVLGCQPIHEFVHARKDSVVVQDFVHNRFGFRTDLVFGFFVHAAVDCVQQGFRQVGACTEELHLFADHHRADAAGNGVVVAVEIRTHQIVVFVLDGRSIDGHFGAKLFKALRQLFGPQYGDVRFGRRTHVVQGVQHAEVGTGYQRAAVQTHTADGFGCPNRVAGEELVVFGRTQETNHTQFHHQMVDKFLRLGFGNYAVFQVALDVDIQE